jgi:hypothetical protein
MPDRGPIAVPTWFNYSAVTPVIEDYLDDGSRDLCKGRIT